MRTKDRKGITLVTLVITIFVLLVLAVVVIASVTKDSIIDNANKISSDWNDASKLEKDNKEELNDFLNEINGRPSTGGNINVNGSYYGKSAVFVGDSITYGEGTSAGSRYWELLKTSLNLSSVTGMGVSGSSISAQSKRSDTYVPLMNRYNSIPRADLIMIFMGTNDYGHETPLGTIKDTTDISFYGALNVIISSLTSKYPTSELIFVTPLHRYGYGTSPTTGEAYTYDYLPNYEGASLGDYVQAIKDVCQKYSIPVIDLYSLSGLDPSIASTRTEYMPDGIHPNAKGHKLIADIIKEQLED